MGLAARFVLVIGGAAAYLALSVRGWGGAAFFANPARIALAIVTLAMALVAMFAGGNLSSGVREDRGNRWVIAAFGALGLLIGFLPAYTDRTDFWTIDGEDIRWLGVVIYAAGGALRLWPVFILGAEIQRARGDSARTYASDKRNLRNHPPPELPWSLAYRARWAFAFRSGVGLILFALMIPVVLS